MRLLSDEALERSAVVANCRMNRERNLAGTNGYDKELGFNPLDVLKEMLGDEGRLAWLDLCCGSGKALIQAAEQVHAGGLSARVDILGVDLVGMFLPSRADLTCLRLVEASLRSWQAEHAYELITCVHGLHYVGDKLGLITRAASWLTPDGRFVANLDLGNLKRANGQPVGRKMVTSLRHCGLEYDRRRRLVTCPGRRTIALPYRYLGADDQAGPNYTRQPAVDSYYEALRSSVGSDSAPE
jgi:SAM-dependent methyltransferase